MQLAAALAWAYSDLTKKKGDGGKKSDSKKSDDKKSGSTTKDK